MSSPNSSPARRNGNDRVLTIDWKLLWGRTRARLSQLFVSLRHKASNTEYIPPAWMQRFRLTWFRIGLMLLALFVFTQKQVDFTVSVGKEGIAMGQSEGRHSAGKTSRTAGSAANAGLGFLPVSSTSSGTSTSGTTPLKWDVNTLDAASVRAYVNRFEKVAQGEEVKFNIPAPANMALAILFSQAGQSDAAKRNNNHFDPVTNGSYYDNAWSNWRAHSEFLNKRFPELADNSVNYQQWIAALAKTGYSADRKLADKVMDVVKRFNLDRL